MAASQHEASVARSRIRELLTFRNVMIILIAAFIYRHEVHIDVGVERAAQSPGLTAAPTAQFASIMPEHSDVELVRRAYVERYAPIAVREMQSSGIPASITLAQGLLESVAGTSRLALRTNNHFGIKCFSKSCAAGHCRNFDDDHHKDFFRSYADPAESYRAHSKFLQSGKRYAGLFKLRANDYKGWAHGLSKAGYATDPKYAAKLISLVERYDLVRYDLVRYDR